MTLWSSWAGLGKVAEEHALDEARGDRPGEEDVADVARRVVERRRTHLRPAEDQIRGGPDRRVHHGGRELVLDADPRAGARGKRRLENHNAIGGSDQAVGTTRPEGRDVWKLVVSTVNYPWRSAPGDVQDLR